MVEIGQVCYKIAGRDSNQPCVIVDIVDERTVTVDTVTRRRNVNILHVEPTKVVLEIKKGADSNAVAEALVANGFSIPKKGAARKTPARAKKEKAVKNPSKKSEPKPGNKVTKKTTKKAAPAEEKA